jgi:Copper amine oxidase, enzyme domain
VTKCFCFMKPLGFLFLLFLAQVSDRVQSAEIEQYFPAVPDGQPKPDTQSGWRIKYDILDPGNHSYGRSAILQFSSVEFMRGHQPDGSPDWIKILNNLAMAEIYVPYNDGTYILDIQGRSHYGLPVLSGFGLVKARGDYLPKYGAISAKVETDGYLLSEVVDDGIRFMDGHKTDAVRRGQILWLWTTLSASNYRYVLRYGFSDDGTISVRVGGTAENLYDDGDPPGNKPVHVHMAAWRMEFDLGNAEKNMIEIAERIPDLSSGGANVKVRAFNNGLEGGEKWNPEAFTTLHIMSEQTVNRHNPPRHIGYKLMPMRMGSVRTTQSITNFDFWLTRRNPDDAKRLALAPELKFVDVPDNIRRPEPTMNKATVLWYTSAVNHMPRTEDFGAVGYHRRDGVAIAMWTGFDLMPHDLWDKTPFLER